jgi:hypothetical protein
MHIPEPDVNLPHLSDVVPSLLAAMGVAGFSGSIVLPAPLHSACVLLIDGLGAELLDSYAADAPVLAGMRAGTLTVGFPSTTAAGLAAIGTGCASGEHGMVGYTFRLPDVGVINALRWQPHPWGPDLRETAIPERTQPRPTTFERAVDAGIAVTVISGAQFDGSGLTRAVLRGGRYAGVLALGDLAARIGEALGEGGFCYGYHSELDLLGHLHGPGSPPWRMQLRQVDRLVESIVDTLPPSALLAVVADHGMVGVDPATAVDLDNSPTLMAGVEAVGGEPRARHVYTVSGAADDVLATWREDLGAKAWVVSRDEAIAAGWFGPRIDDAVLPRIGDVIAAARGNVAIIRSATEPLESALTGHHGSLTDAEQLVPLLLAHNG